LQIAKERGYKRIIILEDDVEFLVSKEDFQGAMNDLKDVYYDVCFLSNEWVHLADVDYNKLHISQRTLMTSGYIVSDRHYDNLIRELELTTVMFDLLGVDWMTYMDFAWNQLQSKLNIRMLLLDRFTEEWL
jgi:GR25 family glycosyltransferase involved in LPS biosynthesis